MSFSTIFINAASIVSIGIITAYAWRKRGNTGVSQFIVATLFMMIWAISSFAEMAVADFGHKILWRNITQIGIFYVPAASLFFSIAYAGIMKKSRKKLAFLVYGIQTVSILLIFTDGWHHLMRKSIDVVQTGLNAVVVVESTLLAKLLISLNFIYMAASLILLIAYAVRTTNNMRKQVLITTAGMGIAVVYSLIKVTSSEQIGTFLPISGVFAMVAFALLFGIFKYDFLAVLPVARNEVFNVIDEGILVCSASGEVLDANDAAIRIFSNNTPEPIERNASGFAIIDEILRKRYPDWHDTLTRFQSAQLDLSQPAGQQMYYYHCNTYVLDNDKNHAIGTISVIRDVTEQKLKNDLLRHRAEHDSLIDIYNRHTFIERIDDELTHYHDDASLIFFDLDDFKSINDRYGHVAGDYVLKTVCSCIKQEIGTQSIIGRMGGEEFAIFFKGKNFQQSLAIAEQLRKDVEEKEFLFDGQRIDVTISAGIATARSVSFVQLYQEADKMLYQAKDAGKNCVKPSPSSESIA